MSKTWRGGEQTGARGAEILGWSTWLKEVEEASGSQGVAAVVGEQEDVSSQAQLGQRAVEEDEDVAGLWKLCG